MAKHLWGRGFAPSKPSAARQFLSRRNSEKFSRLSQRANHQFRLIRDNRIHAPRCELTHALGAIHRPDHDSLPRRMHQFDQFSIRQFELRNHPLRRHFAPTSKLTPRLTKKSQRNPRIERVDCHKHIGKKRRNHESLLRRMLAQFSERLQSQPRNLQLDIEKRPLCKLPQYIFQCGQRQALRRRVLDLHPSDGRVVADHSLPVGGKPHVEFEPVAAVAQTKLKRCQSIFRNLAESPSPTMPQKKRKTHASVCFSRRPQRLGGEKAATPQSKSKSRIGFPVSGVSLAFFTASWNFFSSSSEACFCASIDWRKIESRRLSCSFMARAASSISLKVFGLTGAVCAMMLRVAASIFITAPQQGQVTSKLDSRELDSRFTTRDHTAIGRNWPQSASARREANRQNIEQIQHFPTQQNDRHHHHQNRQNLAKAQTPVMFETARPQAQNIQRGEAKHQRPENVVNLPAGRSQKEHSGQNPDRQRAQSTARELYPPVGLPRYNKQR